MLFIRKISKQNVYYAILIVIWTEQWTCMSKHFRACAYHNVAMVELFRIYFADSSLQNIYVLKTCYKSEHSEKCSTNVCYGSLEMWDKCLEDSFKFLANKDSFADSVN